MASAQLRPLSPADLQEDHKPLYEQASTLYSVAVAEHAPALLDDALEKAEAAYAIRPSYLPGVNLLARIEMQRGRYTSAERWVNTGLQLKPDSASLLYSAGHIALAENNLKKADDYFTRSARISRVATRAVNSLAHVKLLQGDYVEAFRHYRELIKTQSRDKQIRSKLFEAANFVSADFYSRELEEDLLRYFEFNDVDFSQLRSLATSLLKHKLRLSEQGCPLEMEQIVSDPLLLACLQKFYFSDPLMERLLITVRQAVLFSSSRNLSVRQDELALVVALARQTQLNEGVWYITPQERALTDQLGEVVSKMLQMEPLSGTDLFPALMLVLMYTPLQECSFASELESRKLKWPASGETFLRQLLSESRQLKQAASRMRCLDDHSANDQVSDLVRQQYDRNPYPRWTDIGYNQPSAYRAALQQAFPQADLSAIPERDTDVLVAGCGTGRHAIRLAHYFRPLTITAIDLSISALAYASIQARKRQTEIDFVQGNLLNCAALQKSFDVIECSGVLHHMQNPQAGLQALAAILRPGGVIKVALYSATARQQITRLRAMWQGNLPREPQDIRLVREAILQKTLTGHWEEIYNSPDFYSLSACRDLLFHEQEHVFDVLDLPAFASEAGLNWLGMVTPGNHAEIAATGKSAGLLTPTEWHQLEQQKPGLFNGMYQFYLQKPAQ